jgi:hypothetical protein
MNATSSLNSGKAGTKSRSVLAVLAGLITVFVLSLTMDYVFRMLEVFPPSDVMMSETGDYVLASSYRLVINTFGCWLAARLAPQNPMKHALILGWIALALTIVGLVGAIVQNTGHLWYPTLLALTAVPCAWLGGKLYTRAHT